MTNSNADVISDDVKQVIWGSLLGDGSLIPTGFGGHARFSERHGIQQHKYLLWKAKMLVAFNPRIYFQKTFHKVRKKAYSSYTLHTRRNDYFAFELRRWYQMRQTNGWFPIRFHKVIPTEVIPHLNRLAIAVMYLDDGHYQVNNGAAFICTNAFEKTAVELLSARINELTGAITYPRRRPVKTSRGQDMYEIYVSAKTFPAFRDAIRACVPTIECVQYKFGAVSDNRLKLLRTIADTLARNGIRTSSAAVRFIARERGMGVVSAYACIRDMIQTKLAEVETQRTNIPRKYGGTEPRKIHFITESEQHVSTD